jgi:hypothetical protein
MVKMVKKQTSEKTTFSTRILTLYLCGFTQFLSGALVGWGIQFHI